MQERGGGYVICNDSQKLENEQEAEGEDGEEWGEAAQQVHALMAEAWREADTLATTRRWWLMNFTMQFGDDDHNLADNNPKTPMSGRRRRGGKCNQKRRKENMNEWVEEKQEIKMCMYIVIVKAIRIALTTTTN